MNAMVLRTHRSIACVLHGPQAHVRSSFGVGNVANEGWWIRTTDDHGKLLFSRPCLLVDAAANPIGSLAKPSVRILFRPCGPHVKTRNRWWQGARTSDCPFCHRRSDLPKSDAPLHTLTIGLAASLPKQLEVERRHRPGSSRCFGPSRSAFEGRPSYWHLTSKIVLASRRVCASMDSEVVSFRSYRPWPAFPSIRKTCQKPFSNENPRDSVVRPRDPVLGRRVLLVVGAPPLHVRIQRFRRRPSFVACPSHRDSTSFPPTRATR